jgi:dephospho-CoA kinase
MIITVTGRMGSGKNTVMAMLPLSSDYKVIDADEIGHELLTRSYVVSRIALSFPEAVEEGVINRKKLAELAFPDKVNILNQIVHPYLIEEIHSHLHPNMLIHSALPKELKLIELSDLMIFIDSTDKTIKERLKDKFSEDDIVNRLKAQNTRKWYQEIADVVIDNNGTIEDLKKEIDKKCKNLF